MKDALVYMRRGELVPDATVWEMVRERAECLHCAGGFILDGFARTMAQAVSLKQFLVKDRLGVTAVISYELPSSEIVSRLGGRRTCEKCKSVYHVTGRPPKMGGRCDRCARRLFQREDDRPKSIKVRLEAYRRSTPPLIDFYRLAGLLLQVSATGTPEGSMTVRSPIWRRGGFDDLRSGCGRPKKTAETPERSKNSGDANRRGGITSLKLFEGPD